MCHLSMKLSDKFDPNQMYTSMKLRSFLPCLIKIPLILLIKQKKNHNNKTKTLSKLDPEPKCHGQSRNQKMMTWPKKTCDPKKCLSNWCDADTDSIPSLKKSLR